MSESIVELNYKAIIFEQLFVSRTQDSKGELTALFTFSELETRFNMEGCTKNSFDNLMRRFMEECIAFVNEKGEEYKINVFKKMMTYKDEKLGWCVEVTANKEAYEHICDNDNPRRIYLEKLKSLSIVRLYMLLYRYKKEKKMDFEISVSNLRSHLFIQDDKYKRWDNFKRKILDAGRSQINEITDMEFSYERGEAGPGGRWKTVVFHITEK